MTTLETVIEMKRRGMTESEISRNLQSQGIPPSEINNALNQAKIKSEIQGQNTSMQPQQSIIDTGHAMESFPQTNSQNNQASNNSEYNQVNNGSGFNPLNSSPGYNQTNNNSQQVQQQSFNQNTQPLPSIMDSQSGVTSYPQETQAYPQEALYSEDQYYQPGSYGESGDYSDDYYSGGGYTDTETITEISQQVVNEKFREYNKKTGDMALFKTMIQDKVNIIEQRLKRIEDNFDKIQHAIIQKIGEFGENTNLIRRDLEGLHNTTSKLMNPLIDHYRELEKNKKP